LKTAWNIIAILCLLNLVLLAGGVAWLYETGRLDRTRYDAMVAMFKPTIARQQADEEAQRKKEEALRVEREKIAHLKQVEQGPVTLSDRLSADQQADEMALQRMSRLQTEIADLRQGLASQNQQLAMERQQLVEDRRAFEAELSRRQAMLASVDFRRAVETLEQIKPAQAKQMLEDLSTKGKSDQVVEYLVAMDLRKSAAVLREYKTPAEITEAAALLEKIRLRRTESASAANTHSGSNG
jgi:hypothetical protein